MAAGTRGTGRATRLPALAAVACVVGFVTVYFGFVWTHRGQALEFAVLQRAPMSPETPSVVRATFWLDHVNEYSVGAVLLLVVLVGLLRRRPALAAAGTAVIVVTAALDRILVRWVLVRPNLVDDPANPDNSFPSGHVAMATSALLGLLIVVPPAWRGVTALVGAVPVLGVAEMTMTLSWHRLSDTVGGNLLALGVACFGVAALVRRGGARVLTRRERLLGGLLGIVPLLGYGVWTVARVAGEPLFPVAGALATAFSTLTVVIFLAVLLRAEPAATTRA
ncbi:phosphatase PAP2 family protein [Amycolatopsis sp. NPDC059027]|uniref:phosphatase PAP2 family protein n=1 Tax=unclassified Amycolatopsis TaxID=2618356 RepID=UPI00366A7A56